MPWEFTEQGVAMLSSVLPSPQAAIVNIEIARASVRLREGRLRPGDPTREAGGIYLESDRAKVDVAWLAERQPHQPAGRHGRIAGVIVKHEVPQTVDDRPAAVDVDGLGDVRMVPDEDTRTPEELLDIIEEKGQEIAKASAVLRSLP